ncbi:fasciclin-2 isoform X3 [Cephus cinctus]|uniref:Fasciclin-2 isoform X3 n=1 Tax=Cephus cinctus TaxID=211228 RepID=A0AAJ7RAE5_CEPCN|nr:fasciclin-2 isoform X3 [Cephus cinctus]
MVDDYAWTRNKSWRCENKGRRKIRRNDEEREKVTAHANAPSLVILPSGDVQTKPIGSSIVLTCTPDVEKLELVTDMQWLDPQNRVIESLNNVQGTTKPTIYTEMNQDNSLKLLFDSLKEDQEGQYTCKANYASNIQLIKTVTINTIIAITWDDAPLDQFPILGEDYSVKCKVRARPSPSVDWLFNDEVIRTNDHYIIETHALKIKNVQESDDGIYTCRASVATTGELKRRAIRVEVHVRPVIEELKSPLEIIEGENANIACNARGKPPPKFSWVKSLRQQNLSSADRFGVNPDTGVLTITNVNREDAREYQCIATNAAGRAIANIRVDVIVKPKIMEFLNETVAVGNATSISCRAFGRPPPKITFRKHTSSRPFVMGIQSDDDRITLENESSDVTGETVGTLNIQKVMRSDDGLYECIAKNQGGDAFKSGHVTVEFPPSFTSMSNQTVYSWEQKPVNLTCIAESIPNATIRWTMHGDEPIRNYPQIRQIGTGPISVLNIVPIDNRYYTNYKCIAQNRYGAPERIIELREAKRPGELLQVKITEITATTITFDIIPPVTLPDMPIRTINVQYKEESQNWVEAKNRTWTLNSLYVVENLKPQTQYNFRFSSANAVGSSNWANHLTRMTPVKTVPNPPKMLSKLPEGKDYEVSKFNSQYQLRWVAPPDNGEPIDVYRIRYCKTERISGEWQVQEGTCYTVDTRKTDYYLKDLQADAYYKVELKAHNKIGYGAPTYLTFKTARGPTVITHEGPLISSAAIIGIVIAILFILIVIIDVICCCTHKTGIIFYVCERSRRKPVDEEDAKLGSLYGWRFPLPYCDQKMANVAGVTAIQDSGSGKNTIRLVKHTAIEEKEPLKEEKKITPIIDSGLRRETSITFDGKRSVSKTGFVGKDSAV